MADSFDIEMAELNTLARDLSNAGVRVGARAALVIRKTAMDVIATAQTFVPVDTGATKTSIGADFEGDGRSAAMAAEIGPTTNYAAHLEYGTVNMAPHAFMGPALDKHTPSFVDALEQIVGEL